MNKRAALVTVHGMGNTAHGYSKTLQKGLQKRLGDKFQHLLIEEVLYQDILQANEDKVWQRTAPKVRWKALREFILFGFADAASLESGKEKPGSVYRLAQENIARVLLDVKRKTDDDALLIIIAHSLGGQVMSNYFWDANQAANPVGIWRHPEAFAALFNQGQPLSAEELHFMRGRTLGTFITTGCNIPIFVAAHATNNILPMQPNEHFRWENYYDKDDVLGWPLADLSPQYESVVKDIPVNAGQGVIGRVLKSWNPLSHTQYWGDRQVLDPLAEKLKACL